MQQFNEREKSIITKILESKTNYILLNDFLQKLYFSAQSKRALILQAHGHYAVFFLAPEIFDDEAKNSEEVKLFFELISLLNYLNKTGYITIYREKTEQLYFFQETFVDPKASNNTSIILNSKGDYTFSPDTIHDKNKTVIYKGIIFNSDIFELILNSTTGVLVISEKLSELIAPEKKPVTTLEEDKKPVTGSGISTPLISKISAFTGVLIIIILAGMLYLSYHKATKYDAQLKQIIGNNMSIQTGLHKGFTDLKETIEQTVTNPYTPVDSLSYLHGIDISKWNGDAATQIDPTDSISFIICKATEGITGTDSDFDENWKIITDKKCILGAYHFYHTDDDPIKQAEHFLAVVNAKGKTDIPPIVDIEQASLPPNAKINIAALQKNFLKFLTYIELKSKRTPMIYTDGAFANEYLVNVLLSKYSLWLAEYTSTNFPETPVTWKERGYKIWQKRDNYFIDTHPYDFDVFHGKKTDLYK